LDPTADPDSQLMLRVREGDREAFRSLYDKYLGAITRFAGNFVASPARGEELAQDVFLQVYRARDRYEPRAKFSTWIYTIAHNLCLNEVRRFDYRGRVESFEREEGESRAAGRQTEARVRELVAALPESQRTALILSRVEELRYVEIGEILGCSEQAVKSLIFRATRTLKEGLKDYMDGPDTSSPEIGLRRGT
jgi:RNA polymerase sigma-70 factor, ECF subfamily